MSRDLLTLPADLPVPEDDGACDRLPGMSLQPIALTATDGSSVDLSSLPGRTVVYAYPRTGQPDKPPGPDWDQIPGARGCTPQSCAFRDAHGELEALGVRVAGLSAQPLEEQMEFAERNGMPFPVIADPGLHLRDALRLPTFTTDGLELYKRVTLVALDGVIAKVFYPVFPPDANAADVLGWLRSEAGRRGRPGTP